MPNKLLVRNPALNEFIFSIMYSLTWEQKKKLSKPFLYIAKSEVRTKNFAEFSTLDEKVRLLSELGFENALVFFQDKLNSVNALKVILEKYEKEKIASAAKDIAAIKVFVSSDKQVKWLLGLMSDTISHRSYFLNLEFNRAGYHIKGWKPKRDTIASRQLNETIESADLVANTILNSCVALSFVDGLIGVNSYQIKVLLYLYNYRHTYIEKQRIWDYFAGDFTKQKCTSTMKRLFLNNHVTKHADLSNLRYSISTSGIDCVNMFIQRVLKQNNF